MKLLITMLVVILAGEVGWSQDAKALAADNSTNAVATLHDGAQESEADHGASGVNAPDRSDEIRAKMKHLKIDQVDFKDTSLKDIVDILHKKSIAADPTGEGINFYIKPMVFTNSVVEQDGTTNAVVITSGTQRITLSASSITIA